MNKTGLIVAALMLGVGLAGGYGYSEFRRQMMPPTDAEEPASEPLFYRNPMNPAVTSPVPATDSMGMDYVPVFADQAVPAEKKVLFYRSPMNPAVTSPTPAKDSMGMDYVPVYADAVPSEDVAGTVAIDPVVVQNIGVRTAIAHLGSLSRSVRAVGRVVFDEERVTRLHPKVEGWIEDMRVDKTGQSVRKNQILLDIYAPKLVTAQQEYLLALNNLELLKESSFDEIRSGAEELVTSSRYRLQLLDVPEHQIKELEQSRKIKKSLHIHSPQAGTVIDIGARAGQYITPGTELYMMVDLRQVWVYADVYDYEMPWVKVGDTATMTLASVPGRTFTGTVSYIYPYAESKTRTTKIRLVFDNNDLTLRPDLLTDVVIQSDQQDAAVIIPSEAVVRSGERSLVFVMREPGKFEPRPVTLGIETDGKVVVTEGVRSGDEVVTSAQFLIDSESKLREATAKMLRAGSQSANEPDLINDMSQGSDDAAREGRGSSAPGQKAENGGHAHD